VDISDVMRRSLEAMAPLAEARQHRIEVEWSTSPVLVSGDANRLTQLLTNLLNNAARYTPNAGSISISGNVDGNNAVVRVRDNGKGISSDMLEHIFDMFIQGRGLQESAERGLGIGLALSRRIAELHGGTVQAYSAGPGKGSEFVVKIPLASPDAKAAESAPEPAPATAQAHARQKCKRVLIVDDNADAAGSMSLLLQSLGHLTRVVNDSTQALDMTKQFLPEVVLLDIGMPGMNGHEVARGIRQLEIEQPRIIAVTGWGQEPDRSKSHEAGFDMHLLKPAEFSELIAAINGDERPPDKKPAKV